MTETDNGEAKDFLESEEVKKLGEAVQKSLEPLRTVQEGMVKQSEELTKNIEEIKKYQAEKEVQPFIQTELLNKVLKEIKDPFVKALTEETFYLSLVIGLVTISVFLYDKVSYLELAQTQIIGSIGLIWISLLAKYIGYSVNSKIWKDISTVFMAFSIFLQGIIILRLFGSGFFAISTTNITRTNISP